MSLDTLDFHLVNDWQRGFPLVPRPYAELAHRLDLSEAEVIARLRRLAEGGTVSRIGAVFRPHTLGWSTLAAVAVAPARIESVAQSISAYAEVNHNYQREHDFNLWFVVTAPTRARVAAVLADIGRAAGAAPLDLPMLEDFHIDLGFDLGGKRGTGFRRVESRRSHLDGAGEAAASEHIRCRLERLDYALAAALEGGIALVSRPYAALGAGLGLTEEAVLARLDRLSQWGVIRRFGVVVRHRELGYTANAMVVWDVPDQAVAEVGRRLARQPAVTLCYRRPRRLPEWRYNLFSMVHGQDRQAVVAQLAGMRRELGLEHFASQPLFSCRRFKQCGARYSGLAQAA